MIVTIAKTAPKILRPISWNAGSSAAGSSVTISSSRSRSPHITAKITPPTTASFTNPLTKLTSESRENRRLPPSSGEIFENLGMIGSTESSGRCCTRFAATPNTRSTTSGTSATERIVQVRLEKNDVSAGPPISNSSALASSVLREAARFTVVGAAISEHSRPVPALRRASTSPEHLKLILVVGVVPPHHHRDQDRDEDQPDPDRGWHHHKEH